jgi:Ca-activated chloride channel family protein
MRRAIAAGLCSLALVTLASSVRAQGWIVPRPCLMPVRAADDRAIAVPVRECGSRIERTQSDVRVELTDRVLKYEVDERFINRGGVVGEADYLFPLPANAAFQDLKLSINGELVSGETMDAGRARDIYETIVRARRDPALVEWVGHGLVRARIFPINPGEEKRVVIRFQSVAAREGGALRVDYMRGNNPTARPAGTNDSPRVTFALRYHPSNQLGTPYSPTHELSFSDSEGFRIANVRGDARDVTMLVPVRSNGETSISMLPYAPGNEDGFALISVTPPTQRREDVTPRDVTLVLDVSGSMNGRKIEQARAAGHQLLGTLRANDRFRLIDFASDVHTFRDDFVDATAANVREANRYLGALEANGSTNIEGALREALRPEPARGRLPLILFVTDGEPTIGDRNPDHLAAIATDANAHASTTRRIFTFGLGSDVNVNLLDQLALDGRGTSQFVRPDESVERMVSVVADRLVDPVLTDVRVRVEGDARLSKMLPTQTADIFADRDLVLFARYAGHGQSRVVVEGNRRGVPVRWTSTVEFPERERDNPFVARLWATQRVGYLSAEKRQHGNSKEIDDEIKSLGERFSIPTEFTSYLVKEADVAMTNVRGAIEPAPRAMMRDAMASAADRRDGQFEAAKAASAQRIAISASAVDSIADSRLGVGAAATTRRVDGRTFILRDSLWTDTRYQTSMRTTAIKPFSAAYFDLLARLPELRGALALGAHIIVVGKDRAIAIADSGVTQLSAADMNAIVNAW